MKIVLGGPPRSGKSCLRERLKTALRDRAGLYAYVLTVNPDGEGSWFQEAYQADSALAVGLRAAHKGAWTDEHVHIYAEWVRDCTHPLTLLDVGGRPDARNEVICAAATHAILLAATVEAFTPWRAFCEKLGLRLLAEIRSDYDSATDSVEGVDGGVLRGAVHYLERGVLAGERPTVDALADHIVGSLQHLTRLY
jgi:CRISPR-associated protein Csx3